MIATLVALYLILVNLVAFEAFRLDKKAARIGEWRFPEASLLALSLIGGWAGAKTAQHLFRHKTRKQPFRTLLNAVPLVWCAAAFLLSVDLRAPASADTTAASAGDRATPRFFQSARN